MKRKNNILVIKPACEELLKAFEELYLEDLLDKQINIFIHLCMTDGFSQRVYKYAEDNVVKMYIDNEAYFKLECRNFKLLKDIDLIVSTYHL